MSESPFIQILEQATNEFNAFASKINKGGVGVYPKSFEGRIFRLLKNDTLGKVFDQVCPVEEFKPGDKPCDVVAFVPNHPDFLQIVLNVFQQLPEIYKLHVLIMPRYGSRCQKLVAQTGMAERLDIVEFHGDMILLEDYEFLVPAPNCFKRIYIDGDIDDLYLISRSLVKVEILHGMFPEIVTYGDNSARVAHLLHEMKAQIGLGAFQSQPTFSQCIIIDRHCDNMTPLLTQLTYNGILDENLKIDCGIFPFPADIKPLENGNSTIILSDKDLVFKDIRGLGVTQASEFIGAASEEMKSVHAALVEGMDLAKFQVQSKKAKSLGDRKEMFAKHLDIIAYLAVAKSQNPNFNEAISFELASLLNQDPELDLANRLMRTDENWPEAMRLYCIASQAHGGLSYQEISYFRKQVIGKFGLDFVKTLEQFEAIGLLTQNKSSFFGPKQYNFHQTAQIFDLLPKNSDEQVVKDFNEKDIGSFYEGYVPLTARLVQLAVKHETEVPVKARTLEFLGIKCNKLVINDQPFAEEPDVKKVLVFIIGGMTYSEAIAIRELGKRIFNGSVEFYLGSTEILTGTRLLAQMCPDL